jgi:hypothetical protein
MPSSGVPHLGIRGSGGSVSISKESARKKRLFPEHPKQNGYSDAEQNASPKEELEDRKSDQPQDDEADGNQDGG